MLASLEGLYKAAPAIIAEAAKTPFGIFALMILAIGVMGAYFFRDAPVAARLLVYFALLAGVAGFGTAIWRDPMSVSERVLLERDQEVNVLRGVYESIPTSGESVRDDVSAKAGPLGDEVGRIADDHLRAGYQIQKYQNVAYAYVMAADTDRDELNQRQYAQKAVDAVHRSLELLKLTQSRADSDAYLSRVAKWARDNQEASRLNLVLAMALTIKARATHAEVPKEVPTILDELPTTFKERYPPDRNPILRSLEPRPIS